MFNGGTRWFETSENSFHVSNELFVGQEPSCMFIVLLKNENNCEKRFYYDLYKYVYNR